MVNKCILGLDLRSSRVGECVRLWTRKGLSVNLLSAITHFRFNAFYVAAKNLLKIPYPNSSHAANTPELCLHMQMDKGSFAQIN